MPLRDPEPFTTEDTGEYWEVFDPPGPPGLNDADCPPSLCECGHEVEDWDAYCERCGQPVSTWGILRDMALMERHKLERAA